MTSNYFEELMGEFGCSAHSGTAIGQTGKYPYSAILEKSGKNSHIIVSFLVDGSARKVASELSKKKGNHTKWSTTTTQQGQGVLIAHLRPPSDFYAKSDMLGLFLAARTSLSTAGLNAPETCPLCGKKECDVYAFLDDVARATHTDCLLNKLELPEADTTLPTYVKGNVFFGILGAVLGAILGALPSWVQALNNLSINWIMYAFIPILSAMLYRLFRGRANLLLAGLSVLASSFLVAFALEQVWYWLYLTQSGESLMFEHTFWHYIDSHNILISIGEMWQGLLAIVAGFFPGAVILRRYCDAGTIKPHPIRGAYFVRASAVAIGAAMPKRAQAPAQKDAPPQKQALLTPLPKKDAPVDDTPAAESTPPKADILPEEKPPANTAEGAPPLSEERESATDPGATDAQSAKWDSISRRKPSLSGMPEITAKSKSAKSTDAGTKKGSTPPKKTDASKSASSAKSANAPTTQSNTKSTTATTSASNQDDTTAQSATRRASARRRRK